MVIEEEYSEPGERLSYSEIPVSSFTKSVEHIKREDFGDSPVFCLVDIDGTLIVNPLVKLPILSHLTKPTIEEDVEASFLELVSLLGEGNVTLITNRNEWEKFLWNSDEVLAASTSLLQKAGLKDSLVTTLNRQIPGLSRKRCDTLLSKIHISIGESNRLRLLAVEDHSFISPNRNHFLEYIAKRLLRDSGVDVEITNYVIRS